MARAKKTASKSTGKSRVQKSPKKKAASKKSTTKKAPVGKKTATGKTDRAKKAVKKTVKKVAAKKSAAKKTVKKTVRKTAKRVQKTVRKKVGRKKQLSQEEKSLLFAPLTEGERADSLRHLLEEDRLASMAKIGRYQVIAIEPLALKTSIPCRIARIVIYDYSSDQCVEANVNLRTCQVDSLHFSRAQPMLSCEEERRATAIAMGDEKLLSLLNLGDAPQAAMHYWSNKPTDLAHSQRSAAVLFGQPESRPSLVAIIDFLEAQVIKIVPASLW